MTVPTPAGKLARLVVEVPPAVSQAVRILLPFAERKVPGGRKGSSLGMSRAALNGCFKPMLQARLAAVQAFKSAMTTARDAQAILGLTGAPFQEALAINRAFDQSPLLPVFDRNAPAFVRALAGLSAQASRRLSREVFFVCPLLGVLRPGDLVPDYRCPAGADLPAIGSLHRFWKGHVTAALNRLLKGAHVFSFLPARLAALWEPDGREAGITMLRFSRLAGGRCLGETAAVPRLSAEALRHVLESDGRAAQDIVRFRFHDGHAYAAIHSEDRGKVRCLNFVLGREAAASTGC